MYCSCLHANITVPMNTSYLNLSSWRDSKIKVLSL